MSTEPANLHPASISYAVALIPTDPTKSQIASASGAITASFSNRNIIDNVKFPAHLSLYLGGVAAERVGNLGIQLKTATKTFCSSQFLAEKLYREDRSGFLAVECNGPNLLELVEVVFKTCTDFHLKYPNFRPHLIERWSNLSPIQKELVVKYGTYKIPETFRAHLSVALVKKENMHEAFSLAQAKMELPTQFGVSVFQLVDVGHHNEKWDVLSEWGQRD